MRPCARSTHHRLPARSNEGPSRKECIFTWRAASQLEACSVRYRDSGSRANTSVPMGSAGGYMGDPFRIAVDWPAARFPASAN
ncbi:hypothetical protein G6F50_018025 [Rhizopus delemar]|uniref:Uncharacterized protein n=1 Tax=Rhizopus delemar TaxID=936053 RepID=A0A9P6XND7_9FUNG|nr:hypothetical protein G6F50_018025 [Rhizopus delemar]